MYAVNDILAAFREGERMAETSLLPRTLRSSLFGKLVACSVLLAAVSSICQVHCPKSPAGDAFPN